MSRFASIIDGLMQFVQFMRQAEDVRISYGELSGHSGGNRMTAREARLALEQMTNSGVTPRELAIAIRDMRGLRGKEKGLLETAVRGLGPTQPPGYVDIRSASNGRLDGRGVREFVCAMVRLKGRYPAVTFVAESTAGGRVNYSLQGDHSRSGGGGFDAADAQRTVVYLQENGANASAIRSALRGVSGSARELLEMALATHR